MSLFSDRKRQSIKAKIMETIFHLFDVKKENRQKLLNALSTREGLSSWWTTHTEQPQENMWRFHFGNDYHKDFEVEDQSDNHFKWKCEEGAPDWIDTLITFDLEEKNDKIVVKFRHSGWKEQNDNFGLCSFHWALYMKSLQELVEKGTGNPTKVNSK